MLAAASLATAGVSLLGVPLWAEIAMFGVSSFALLALVRPHLRRRLTAPETLDTSPRALVGSRASVLETISSSGGQIRLEGSIWTARSIDSHVTFQPGDTVTVTGFDGPTALVWRE
ncbi:membrane protein implicated in regulation of membrane protease activity [Corynebacterium uterequi]|uniref:Membrane protein implicated in regulation of membrane protease activity n=2 Tax=Corynebacterium uterequi TaxID=1072256 RepID=A0A0G3HGU3_9CORY|nr:membrane protein implicated in regulation of membrane protease activity [Corynebacterium uterequi]